MTGIRRTLAALAIVLASLFTDSCGEDEPWLAPVNPAFLESTAAKTLAPLQATGEGHSLGLIPSPIPPETHLAWLMVAGSPTDPKYDMRDPNNDGNQVDSLLTAVRNQGTCGSCWAFGTYGSLEGHIKQTLAEVQDFSEDNLKHPHGYDSGPISEADDPYDQSPSSAYCTGCTPVRYVDNVVSLPTRANTSDNAYIKQAVIDHDGLYATLYWGDGYYNATYKTYYYGGLSTNHAVVIVGWDNDKYVPNAPAGQRYGAFIVRNSWGQAGAKAGTSTCPTMMRASPFPTWPTSTRPGSQPFPPTESTITTSWAAPVGSDTEAGSPGGQTGSCRPRTKS